MIFKCKNLQITLDENLEKVKEEIEELKKVYMILKENSQTYLLAGKTQLIGKNKLDGIRSRQEHTEGIEIISKNFIKKIYNTVVDDEVKQYPIYKLNLEKELLYAQIIALSHDLGHTPFGHLGESALNKCIKSTDLSKEESSKILANRKKIFGENYELNQGHNKSFKGKISFEHNEQSAKLIYNIIKRNNINTSKIDLSRIIHGVLSHSTTRVKEEDIPKDLVCQIVRQADKIEYTNSDLDEIIDLMEISAFGDEQLIEFIQTPKKIRINEIMQHLVEETLEKGFIDDHMKALQEERKFRKAYQERLFIKGLDGKRGLLTGENVERINIMLTKIYNYYLQNPTKIPIKSMFFTTPIKDEKTSKRIITQSFILEEDNTIQEKIVDFICRMDNEKIEREYLKLVKQRILCGEGHGIEPITSEEIKKSKEKFYKESIQMEKFKGKLSGTEHSEDEYEANMRNTIHNIYQKYLTEKGRKRMSEVRILHEEENIIDKELCELMIFYDKNPQKRSEIDAKKASKISRKIKENWQEEIR